LSSPFDAYVSRLDDLFAQLMSSAKLPLSEGLGFPTTPGCYAILETDTYLYVGIGKNLRRRIKNHIAGRASQSAFAFRLARIEINAPVTYRREGGRLDLMTRPNFIEAMRQTTERVRRMSAQLVTIKDPSLLYLFEFYAAKRLDTPHNDFNTH
jgi:hypothetical protein